MGNPFAGPKPPKPPKPPPVVDETKALVNELNAQATNRMLRQSKGRQSSVLYGEPYRAPGSKPTTGG